MAVGGGLRQPWFRGMLDDGNQLLIWMGGVKGERLANLTLSNALCPSPLRSPNLNFKFGEGFVLERFSGWWWVGKGKGRKKRVMSGGGANCKYHLRDG